MAEVLKAPFPWFGGKSKIAHHVWARFTPAGGDCISNYVEPFAGSLAILLQRPSVSINPTIIETVNDFDCYLVNFWRSIKEDPDVVAKWADYPVSEIDLIARNNWFVEKRPSYREKMLDAEFHDPKAAGWWVWGLSQWIGGGYCDRKVNKKLPHLGGGEGIHSRGPVSLKRKFGVMTLGGAPLHAADEFLSLQGEAIKNRFDVLSRRLRTVRIACGDWTGVMGEAVLTCNGLTGIVLDPPYTAGEHSVKYAGDAHQAQARDIADEVRKWAIKTGEPSSDPKIPHAGPGGKLRIALFGYESERHPMPSDWETIEWTGGFGNQGAVTRRDIEYDPLNAFGKTVAERAAESVVSQSRGRENAGKERIWFSPSCRSEQIGLYDESLIEEGVAV